MIRTTAHAKINWVLEITGKRANGYHTLSTLFQTIALGDRLRFTPATQLQLSCSDPTLPVDSTNLVMKAALRLQAHLKESRGARIHLEKVVPMGAGLGGGSADAAATLQGLLRLWKRRIDPNALQKLAVGIGADVPFFLKGGFCKATGIGEMLTPLKPLPKTWLVIVWPGFGISTKEAYSKVKMSDFGIRPPDSQTGVRQSLSGGRISDLQRRITLLRRQSWIGPLNPKSELRNPTFASPLFNRFESLVFSDHPELPKLKRAFLEAGASASLMSGSGSAVYGVAPHRKAATEIYHRMRKMYPHCWLTHTV